MANVNIQEQAKEILRIAEKYGAEQNFFFLTTFKRYQVQLTILNELEQKIKEDGALVTKEYVKGRANVYTHPAINEYNKTAQASNQTVATLIRIITTMRNDNEDDDVEDELFTAVGIVR